MFICGEVKAFIEMFDYPALELTLGKSFLLRHNLCLLFIFVQLLYHLVNMNSEHWLLLTGWLAFGVIHSITASPQFKKLIQVISTWGHLHYRLLYILIAALSLALLLFYQLSITSILLFTTISGWIPFFLLTGFSGASIMVICVYKYFSAAGNIVLLSPKPISQTLQTGGINKFVRHPLYAGTLLFIWSLFFLYPMLSTLVSNGIITIYVLTGIRFEEKKLINLFGQQYRIYQEKVPMLIPLFKQMLKKFDGSS